MNHISFLSLPIGSFPQLNSRRVEQQSTAGAPGERKAALVLAVLTVLIATVAAFFH